MTEEEVLDQRFLDRRRNYDDTNYILMKFNAQYFPPPFFFSLTDWYARRNRHNRNGAFDAVKICSYFCAVMIRLHVSIKSAELWLILSILAIVPMILLILTRNAMPRVEPDGARRKLGRIRDYVAIFCSPFYQGCLLYSLCMAIRHIRALGQEPGSQITASTRYAGVKMSRILEA